MESVSAVAAVEYRPYDLRPEKYRVGDNGTIQTLGLKGWKDMGTFKRGKGYHIVELSVGGKTIRRNVAHLVLETFSVPRPEGKVCRHLDGNRENNAISNLCWGTLVENVRDSIRHGTHGNTKLTPDDVRAIRDSKESAEDLSRRFGVTARYIKQVRAGRSVWTWV